MRAVAVAALIAVCTPGVRLPAMAAGDSRAGEEVAVVETPHGEIAWRFFPGEAPGHAEYVKELIRSGFYDGTTIHRVIPHFVIQGGDPNSKNDDRSDDGEGEAERRLKAEFSDRMHYRPGTVGMARDSDPDSGSCQFFIAIEDLPRLDGRYTIFGEVVSGLEVARRIARVPRDLKDNPLEPVPVRVRLERRALPSAPEGIVSLSPAAGPGEVLTGPNRPRPFDPGDVQWAAPGPNSSMLPDEPNDAADKTGAGEPGNDGPGNESKKTKSRTAKTTKRVPPRDAAAGPHRGDAGAPGKNDPRARVEPGPVEVTVGVDGAVLDVRFPDLDTPGAEEIRSSLLQVPFHPAELKGAPVKSRFLWHAGTGAASAPNAPGDPVVVSPDIVAPRPLLVITVPEGPEGKQPPTNPVVLRLLVGADGGVLSVSLQAGTGDDALDTAAIERAAAMRFTPARRGVGEGAAEEGEAVAVYLDVRAVFEAAP